MYITSISVVTYVFIQITINYKKKETCSEYSIALNSHRKHCNTTLSYTGQNVTLGVHIGPWTPAFWNLQINNTEISLCEYTHTVLKCNLHTICYQCLSNYSLLLINVTKQYSGIYWLSYDINNGNYKYTEMTLCYNLTVHSRNATSNKLLTTSATHTTITPYVTTNLQHNESIVNDTFQTYYTANNHTPWLALPILIVVLIVLCWFNMPQRYKYQPYTWASCFYRVCTQTHCLQKK
ncbi:Rh22 [macacine betaherpesvirus 3]|nr:Rh22 [macacine betaherpesvirus 3]